MLRLRSAVVLSLVVFAVCALSQQRRNPGRPATPEEIRTRDITILPDGTGLPSGQGTATEGRILYLQKCASCHGERGEGNAYFPALAGGLGTLSSGQANPTIGSYWPYATTVWDYIHRAMPYQSPGTLGSNEAYSLTAYILYLNKIVGENEPLNSQTLPKIQMPNRSGFMPDSRPDTK